MRWPWQKRPEPPAIPAYEPIKVDFKPPEVKEPGMVVTEEEMSATGLFKIFGKRPKE
jgi:hypothetical protein